MGSGHQFIDSPRLDEDLFEKHPSTNPSGMQQDHPLREGFRGHIVADGRSFVRDGEGEPRS